MDQVKAKLIPAKHAQRARIYQDSVIVGKDRVRILIIVLLVFNPLYFLVLFFFYSDYRNLLLFFHLK